MEANDLLLHTTGASFPLFAIQVYEALGVQWATLLLAIVFLLKASMDPTFAEEAVYMANDIKEYIKIYIDICSYFLRRIA